VVADVVQLARLFAQRVEERCARAIALRGRFSLAIPGGSVADAFLPVLGNAGIDWQRVDLFWTDERAVPSDHPDSNHGLAMRLFSGDVLSAVRVHRMRAERDLDEASIEYAGALESVAGHPPSLDFVLLGIGSDGHVCSLFPGSPALDEAQRLVVPVEDAPKPPRRRITLTLPVLEGAEVVCAAAFGNAKSAAVRTALSGDDGGTPIARVRRRARAFWLFLDADAASDIGS
jgi:6-phosphogluconolactonase